MTRGSRKTAGRNAAASDTRPRNLRKTHGGTLPEIAIKSGSIASGGTRAAPKTADRNQAAIGTRLRNLRKSRGKTLADVAAEVGMSVAYLSLLERDQASPNVKTLHDISVALGVNIIWFFDTEGSQLDEMQYIVRKAQRLHISFSQGIVDHKITPQSAKKLGLLYSTFEPGASSGDAPYTHEGEEAGLVLAGQLELVIEGRSYFLGEGDGFAFPSTLEHMYRNPSSDPAVIVCALTPPGY